MGTVAMVSVLTVTATGVVPPPVLASSAEARGSEPVVVERLPLPPTAPGLDAGACDNPTGCLDPGTAGIAEGPGYMWDARHVLLPIRFAGAPASPDPAHIYSGDQVIAVRTDGGSFTNGDPWKCITCGVPDIFGANRSGNGGIVVDHPQAFRDGKRALVGTNVLDCGPHSIVDDECTPDRTKIYPIAPYRPGAIMRELRLHPGDAHLGFSEPVMSGGVFADQFAVLARLTFHPQAQRYELSSVRYLVGRDLAHQGRMIDVDPVDSSRLRFGEPSAVIGEFRGFTNDGKSALGIGTFDSGNFDLFTTDLATAASRRWTHNPAYTDPADMSPDGRSMVYMDGRVNHRMNYSAALPGVPPLTDLVATGAVQFVYNNGDRRFFQPYLAHISDSDSPQPLTHAGQQLNACDDPSPGSGSICDPLWNGRADPTWSPDGTNIVYWQAMVQPPACGATQQTAPICPTSSEPGARPTRLMIARLTARTPQPIVQPAPFSDDIGWATAYSPGDPLPKRPEVPAGAYTLKGRASGSAQVLITAREGGTGIASVEVTYTDYSHDGTNIVNGTESATAAPYTWHSDLTLTGVHSGTRVTSEPSGFVIRPPGAANTRAAIEGTMTTVLDGVTYRSPETGQ
jgi:hypothetical protein